MFAVLAVVWVGACSDGEAAGAVHLAENVRLIPAFGTDGRNAFQYPLWFGAVPGREGAYLVLERGTGRRPGRIWVLEEKDGSHVKSLFLEVPVESSRSLSDERGLLGFAFHPDFPRNRRYYLNYIPARGPGQQKDSTVVEERRAAESLLRDSGERPRRVLAVEQPHWNHNGGSLGFGPDGFLYVGMGDGGSAGDPYGNGQSLKTLLGAMLRVDVDGAESGRGYRIPPDNPFGQKEGARGEIWAFGLRNPWKWSFDQATGKLWAGDVGQRNWEEISIVTAGADMGWDTREGTRCFEPPFGCGGEGSVPPVVEIGRDSAASITGGYVYRGRKSSPFYGRYIFGDYQTRYIWALEEEGGKASDLRIITRSPGLISSFGLDGNGEIHVVGYDNGVIYHLDLPKN